MSLRFSPPPQLRLLDEFKMIVCLFEGDQSLKLLAGNVVALLFLLVALILLILRRRVLAYACQTSLIINGFGTQSGII